MVDSVRVDDRKGLGATLGIRTLFAGVMAKLEEVTRLPERGSLKVRPIPLLFAGASEPCIIRDVCGLTSIEWKGLKECTQLMQPAQRN